MVWTPEPGPQKPMASAKHLVRRWASPPRKELLAVWERARDSGLSGKIAPLD